MSISYADRGGAKGYQVRVTRNGVQYAKFFNSKERGAKKKAQAYEKKLLKLLGPIKSTKGSKREIRTNTGLRYISEGIGKYGTDCYRVTYRKPSGRWASRDISIDLHGRDKALRMAKRMQREHHTPANKPKKPAKRQPTPAQVRRLLG